MIGECGTVWASWGWKDDQQRVSVTHEWSFKGIMDLTRWWGKEYSMKRMQCDGSLRETHSSAVWSSVMEIALDGRNEYGSGMLGRARWVIKVFLCPIKAPGLYA